MGYHVLLVDDDAALRRLVRATLPSEWYEVTEAEDGDEALTAIAEHPPDLLVLDWHMPERSGEEVLAALKGRNHSIPVVVLTAEQRLEEREAAERLGADAFLTKPFSPLDLLHAIEGLLPERPIGS